MMNIVVPTILTFSRDDLEAKLRRVEGLVEAVQIDVVDGKFATPATWPYAHKEDLAGLALQEPWLRTLGHFTFEVDLMVENPEESAEFWIAAGASRLVVHVESTRFLPRLIETLKRTYGYEKGFAPELLSFGLAINIATDTSILEPFLDSVESVQFMGIEKIGKQGQPFDRRVLDKLKAFRRAHPSVLIQVDGGASEETAPDLLACGVDRLVVGSDLWKAEDLQDKLSRFARIAEEYGTYH
jgi:ribulose-phosphate 3-epimerase